MRSSPGSRCVVALLFMTLSQGCELVSYSPLSAKIGGKPDPQTPSEPRSNPQDGPAKNGSDGIETGSGEKNDDSSDTDVAVVPGAPVIEFQPVFIITGSQISFSASAIGDAPLDYQWLKDGVAIHDAVHSSFEISNRSPNDAGKYSVRVSNAKGTAMSKVVELPAGNSPPIIVEQPKSVTVDPRTKVELKVRVAGEGPFTYEWMKDGVSIGPYNFWELAFRGDPIEQGNYSVKISNPYGSVTSNSALFGLNDLPTIEICTAADFDKVRSNLERNFKLVCDVDLTGVEWAPLGVKANSDYIPFSGIFDGNGKTISNLETDVGLFYMSTGVIKNLNLKNVHLVRKSATPKLQAVASLVAYLGFSQAPPAPFGKVVVDNCSATGNAEIGWAGESGGLVGRADESSVIMNSRAAVNITDIGQNLDSIGRVYGSLTSVGGLVGVSIGEIADSSASGNIVGGYSALGGLAGQGKVILRSFATGNITAGPMAYGVGGLAGGAFGTISDSYASGDVSGDSRVGGLLGGGGGMITRVHSSGRVSAQSNQGFAGGLIGEATNWLILDKSYTTSSVQAPIAYAVGGLFGHTSVCLTQLKLTDVYTAGDVTGLEQVGGLIGDLVLCRSGAAGTQPSLIKNVYAKGLVSGSHDVGGLIGHARVAILLGAPFESLESLLTTTSSYWISDLTKQNTSLAGAPLTSQQLSSKVNLPGWDFTNVWSMAPAGYPVLR